MLKIEEKPSCQQRTAANWGFILVWSFTFLSYFSASLSFSLPKSQPSAVRETLEANNDKVCKDYFNKMYKAQAVFFLIKFLP
jgi:hypothetical protein